MSLSRKIKLKVFERHHLKLRRHTCSAEDPWNPGKGKYGIHPNARIHNPKADIGRGSIDLYCPHCHQVFQSIFMEEKE